MYKVLYPLNSNSISLFAQNAIKFQEFSFNGHVLIALVVFIYREREREKS